MAPGKKQHLPFIAINVYHSMTLRNADPDLNEISGGSTDLGQKIAFTYSPPSKKQRAVTAQRVDTIL